MDKHRYCKGVQVPFELIFPSESKNLQQARIDVSNDIFINVRKKIFC